VVRVHIVEFVCSGPDNLLELRFPPGASVTILVDRGLFGLTEATPLATSARWRKWSISSHKENQDVGARPVLVRVWSGTWQLVGRTA